MTTRTLEYERTGIPIMVTGENPLVKAVYGDYLQEEKALLWGNIDAWKRLKDISVSYLTLEQEAILSRGEESLAIVVATNRGFVCEMAMREFGPVLFKRQEEDLIQVGNVALLKAAEVYDFSRGREFTTFAGFKLRSAFQRCSYHPKSEFGVSYTSVEKKSFYSVLDAIAGLLAEDLEPTVENVCARTGLGRNVVATKLNAVAVFSTEFTEMKEEDYLSASMDADREDVIVRGERGRPVEDEALRNVTREEIKRLFFERLTAREQWIVELYSGWRNGVFLNNREVGLMMGLSRETVRLIKEDPGLQERISEIVEIVSN